MIYAKEEERLTNIFKQNYQFKLIQTNKYNDIQKRGEPEKVELAPRHYLEDKRISFAMPDDYH